VRKISECANPLAYMEDMPTVHDPVVVMKQLLIFEFAFQDHKQQGELSQEFLIDFEQKLNDKQNLLSWANYWFRDRDAEAAELDISFNEFLHAVRSCWSIGDTIKFEMRTDTAEITNLRGEAGE
jgi:hypothetical protein